MKFKEIAYGNHTNILAFPDHYVAIPVVVDSTDAAIVANGDGKKILSAGSIIGGGFLTSTTAKATVQNDADAQAVLLHDVDVTDGDAPGAAVIHGFVSTAALTSLSITPSAAAIAALKGIQFVI